MKRVVSSPTQVLERRALPINTWNGQYECYWEILLRIKQQLDAMLSYHRKVLVFQVVLHTNEYSPDNELMGRIIKKLKKALRRRYALARVGHVWVREWNKAKGEADSQHYHLALMVDGSKVQYPAHAIKLIEDILLAWNLPKPFTPKNCYHLLNRTNSGVYEACFYRLSYFAKTKGKGNKATKSKDFSSSRIVKAPLTR